MPKLLAVSILLFLLLGAGYGLATIQAARAIPWDCSDWQAFDHADRPTSILESLAENRGKTLYCGIDSPTPLPKPKPGRPAKTATRGMTQSISGNAASSAALSPPKRVG